MYPEEWLTYRKKGYYAFQDFILKMTDLLKGKEKTVVVRFILSQLEIFK
jgi:hypothetical protein